MTKKRNHTSKKLSKENSIIIKPHLKSSYKKHKVQFFFYFHKIKN